MKSVITCDLEGRIETVNEHAQAIFGYSDDELIGKQRVSLFSPGLIVLQHVNTWLKTAVDEGEYVGQTVFVRKDGSRFAADIRITPTFRKKEHIGYCGVTEPRLDLDPAQAMPPISPFTRFFAALVVTRAPFLTASIIPILIGAAWAAYRGIEGGFSWLLFALVMIGGITLHLAANTFNDYFDWRSGTDKLNNDYFLPYTGGSRSLELGLISEKGLLRLAIIMSAIAALVGLVLMAEVGIGLIAFGLFGLFSALFYTAPPLRLVARRGLGELLIGLNFGPLMVAGTAFVLRGEVSAIDFLVGVPIGLLTAAILWINQFPDTASDIATGKLHLVATLGKETARWGYALLLGGAFALTAIAVALDELPVGALLAWLSLPLALHAGRILFRHYADRSLVRANVATIQLHALFGILLVVGLLAF